MKTASDMIQKSDATLNHQMNILKELVNMLNEFMVTPCDHARFNTLNTEDAEGVWCKRSQTDGCVFRNSHQAFIKELVKQAEYCTSTDHDKNIGISIDSIVAITGFLNFLERRLELKTPRLNESSTFSPKASMHIDALRSLVPHDMRKEITLACAITAIKVLRQHDGSLLQRRTEARYNEDIAPGMKYLLDVVLSAGTSEGLCETVRHQMETYHTRGYMSPLDDERAQKELFIVRNGPPLSRSKALCLKVVKAMNGGNTRSKHKCSTATNPHRNAYQALRHATLEIKQQEKNIAFLDFN